MKKEVDFISWIDDLDKFIKEVEQGQLDRVSEKENELNRYIKENELSVPDPFISTLDEQQDVEEGIEQEREYIPLKFVDQRGFDIKDVYVNRKGRKR